MPQRCWPPMHGAVRPTTCPRPGRTRLTRCPRARTTVRGSRGSTGSRGQGNLHALLSPHPRSIPPTAAVIVGAGPSGSVCGYYLAKKGGKVALLDKETFPRDKCVAAAGSLAAWQPHPWHWHSRCCPPRCRYCGDAVRRGRGLVEDGRAAANAAAAAHAHAAPPPRMLLHVPRRAGVHAALTCTCVAPQVCTPAIHILEDMGVMKVGGARACRCSHAAAVRTLACVCTHGRAAPVWRRQMHALAHTHARPRRSWWTTTRRTLLTRAALCRPTARPTSACPSRSWARCARGGGRGLLPPAAASTPMLCLRTMCVPCGSNGWRR